MSVVEVTCHSEQDLPPGWARGAFWQREGASGYYALDSFGRAVPIRLVPDRAYLWDPAELDNKLKAALCAYCCTPVMTWGLAGRVPWADFTEMPPNIIEVPVHPLQELPPGWSWGTYWKRDDGEGYAEGWYAVDSFGRAVPIRLVQDLAFLFELTELAEQLEDALLAYRGGKR